jgi:hypothetical protein
VYLIGIDCRVAWRRIKGGETSSAAMGAEFRIFFLAAAIYSK